jgi:hypothetical protein
VKELAAIAAGLVVFSIWMSVVGNPHVIETILGVILAVISGVYVWKKLGKVRFKRKA